MNQQSQQVANHHTFSEGEPKELVFAEPKPLAKALGELLMGSKHHKQSRSNQSLAFFAKAKEDTPPRVP